MKLVFLTHPVNDLKTALAFYRNQFGMQEVWREGDHTAALKLDGTDVALMLEEDEKDLPAGGVFLVDSVDEFYKENKDELKFIKEPFDIPPGRYAAFQDDSGNVLRLIDMTKER